MTWSEWEYEVCTNGRIKSRDLVSRRHLRMSHWKIPSAHIVGGHVLVSYDDRERKIYVDGGPALTRVLNSPELLAWDMNDGLNVLRLNTKRKELTMDGELMKMEQNFMDSESVMRLVPFDVRRCKLIERKVIIK